jgi:hypothetical protein
MAGLAVFAEDPGGVRSIPAKHGRQLRELPDQQTGKSNFRRAFRRRRELKTAEAFGQSMKFIEFLGERGASSVRVLSLGVASRR